MLASELEARSSQNDRLVAALESGHPSPSCSWAARPIPPTYAATIHASLCSAPCLKSSFMPSLDSRPQHMH